MRHLDPPRRLLAIALAALSGFVDATGFLSIGGYFASFMSGNTTRLGIDLVTGPVQAIVPAALIAGFVAGVAAGALVAGRTDAYRKTRVLLFASSLLALAAIADRFGPAAFMSLTVVAMGALNNVFRRDGEVAVGVTYMTGALVRFGQGLAARLSGQSDEGRLSAGLLWLGLASGACAGALAFATFRPIAPALALAFCLVLAAAAWRIERSCA